MGIWLLGLRSTGWVEWPLLFDRTEVWKGDAESARKSNFQKRNWYIFSWNNLLWVTSRALACCWQWKSGACAPKILFHTLYTAVVSVWVWKKISWILSIYTSSREREPIRVVSPITQPTQQEGALWAAATMLLVWSTTRYPSRTPPPPPSSSKGALG